MESLCGFGGLSKVSSPKRAEVRALNGGVLFAIYIIKLLIFRCIMFPNGGEWGRMGLNGGLFLA